MNAPAVIAREAWLRPFDPATAGPWTLRGRVRLAGMRLTVRFVLEGQVEDLLLPWPDPLPRRLDELWQTTCFEAFLRPAPGPSYREINLSPAGHWNVYAFDDTRVGMRLEGALDHLDWNSHRVAGVHAIRFMLDLSTLEPTLPADGAMELGLSAVLERRNGRREHWALAHPADRPDFHHPHAFIMRLP